MPSKVVTVTGSVTITFNANGGIGTTAPETEPYDTTAALTPNTFTYVGYTFTGWNSKANGSGTAFTNGALTKFNGSATFYAQWTVASAPTTATITFNANGGIGTMASETETETLNVSATLTTDVFTRTGYTFTAWNTSPTGSGASYANDAAYTFTVSVTLYAQWTAVPTAQFSNPPPNWSGYVVPSSSALVTYAEGEWTVPTMNCADTPNGDVSTWVGIGGTSSTVLLQTGVTTNCVNGAQQNYGWWEEYPSIPNTSRAFTSFPVAAGNQIEAIVAQNSNGSWETTVSDLTTGLSGYMITGEAWGVSITGASSFTDQGSTTGLSYSGGYTAEWIVEDPGVINEAPGNVQPFASFGAVTFSNMRASFSSWSLTPAEEWGIVQNGVTLAAPTATSADGFTDTYTGP